MLNQTISLGWHTGLKINVLFDKYFVLLPIKRDCLNKSSLFLYLVK